MNARTSAIKMNYNYIDTNATPLKSCPVAAFWML